MDKFAEPAREIGILGVVYAEALAADEAAI